MELHPGNIFEVSIQAVYATVVLDRHGGFSGESGRLKKGIQTNVSAMTRSAAFQGGLPADLSPLQLVPVQVEMDHAAQGLESIQLLSSDKFCRRLIDRIDFGFGGCHVHEFPDEFLVEI